MRLGRWFQYNLISILTFVDNISEYIPYIIWAMSTIINFDLLTSLWICINFTRTQVHNNKTENEKSHYY